MRRTQIGLSALLLVLLGSLAWGMVATSTVHAAARTGIIRVAPSGTDSSDCGEAAKPCANIWYAVTLAGEEDQSSPQWRQYAGAEIRVAAGTYRHRPGNAQFSVVHLSFNGTLKINGGYSTSNWDISNPTVNTTVIDGENKFRGISIVPLNTNGNTNCNISIDGFTITNGLASRAVYDGPAGGGIVVNNGCTATLSNLIVKNNRADASVAGTTSSAPFGVGGGIAIQGGTSGNTCNTPTTATLTNITIINNVATGASGVGNGGGLHVTCGKITGNGLVVTGNTVQGGPTTTGSGGGISIISSPSFALSNIQVNENTATSGGNGGEGGGLFVELSTGTIDIATVRGNKATGTYAVGGGVFTTDNGSFTLSNASITQNSLVASSQYAAGGGIILTNATSETAPNSLVGRNLLIAQNSLSSPSSSSGGGIFCDTSTPTLNNITVASNSLAGNGDNYGSGLALINGCTGNLTNSIVSETSTRAPVFTNANTGAVTFNTVLINTTAASPFEDNSNKITKTNILSGDPAFVSASDFHLAGGSAAIDKAGGNAESRDIDGEARTAPADLGADEYSTADVRGSADIPERVTTGSQTINLSWTAPAGRFVAQYQISYEPAATMVSAVTAPSVITVPASQLSYVIRGLTVSGTYNVSITAIGVTGAQVGTSGVFQADVVVPDLTFTFLPLTSN